jgi:segregation and condensation protein B
MTNEERKAALEAIIYAADEPATIEQLAAVLGAEKMIVQASLDELVASYAAEERGIEIRAVAGGYKMYTKPQHHDVVRRFIKSLRPPLRLSMPALETLAVIAYKQPVTGPEISEIRGVNSSGVIATLLDKRLITTAGRKEVMGRPILYKSSKEFLMRFGLSDLQELPSLKEFEALAREALGSDMGVAPTTEEAMLAEPSADTVENLTAAQSSASAHSTPHADSSNPLTTDLADNDQLVPTEFAAPAVGASSADAPAVGAWSPSTSSPGAPSSDLEGGASFSSSGPASISAAGDPCADARGPGAPGAPSAPGSSTAPSDEEFLREREVDSTAEGMPSGELDEEPPKADSAKAGE